MKHFGFFVFLLKGCNPTTLSSLAEYTIVLSSPCPGDRTSTRGKVFPVHAASSISGLGIRSLKTAEGVAFVARWILWNVVIGRRLRRLVSGHCRLHWRWRRCRMLFGLNLRCSLTIWPRTSLTLFITGLFRIGCLALHYLRLRAESFFHLFLKVLIDEGINNVNPVSVLC